MCKFLEAIVEYQSRKADLYLRHLTWQPMTDDDVEWVNTPAKAPDKS